MSRALLITSNKGGVGKSTIAANLSWELYLAGKKVLLLDCDLTARCLDLIFGVESELVYTLGDAVDPGCADPTCAIYSKVRSAPADIGCLHLVPAPNSDEGFDFDRFKVFVRSCVEKYDFVVMDAPPGHKKMLECCVLLADIAYVISTHSRTSVRAAERCAQLMTEQGVGTVKLVINGFQTRGVLKATHPGIVDIIEQTRIELIGVVPYDPALATAQEQGLLAGEGKCPSAQCIKNIARRTCGETVPLEKKLSGVKSENIYFRR